MKRITKKVTKHVATDKYQLNLIKDVGDCIEVHYHEIECTHSAFRTHVCMYGRKRGIKLSVSTCDGHFKVFRKE